MNILFITPTNYGLHAPIYHELLKQGHSVDMLPDNILPHDTGYLTHSTMERMIDSFWNHEKIETNYWDNTFKSHHLDEKHYDMLLAINGKSVCPYLVKRIKETNHQIKTVLYLWDTLNYFRYDRNFPLFDKIYSFDWNDSQADERITFLPFYWMPVQAYDNTAMTTVSTVGSLHDGRLHITRSIAKQFEDYGIDYKFYIYYPWRQGLSLHLIKQAISSLIRADFLTLLDLKALTFHDNSHLITACPMSIEDTNRLMASSKVILDTDMPNQSGPTPRMIWALAHGKRVITTNRYISKMPFYNPEQIRIIDRSNPRIDKDFLINCQSISPNPFFSSLRIDQWIKTLI